MNRVCFRELLERNRDLREQNSMPEDGSEVVLVFQILVILYRLLQEISMSEITMPDRWANKEAYFRTHVFE